MKAPTTGPGGTYVIRSADKGKTYRVVELADHRLDSEEVRVVWTGKSIKEARSRHAAAVYDLPLDKARRLTN